MFQLVSLSNGIFYPYHTATGSTANTLKKSDMDVMTNRDCERTWGRNQIMDFHICINDHDSDSSACMVGTNRNKFFSSGGLEPTRIVL